jgi:hypothetical protein
MSFSFWETSDIVRGTGPEEEDYAPFREAR